MMFVELKMKAGRSPSYKTTYMASEDIHTIEPGWNDTFVVNCKDGERIECQGKARDFVQAINVGNESVH